MAARISEISIICDYYENRFGVKSDLYDYIGSRVYSYQTMREALDLFIQERPDLWRESKLDILGFLSRDRARELGICTKKLRANRHYFAEWIWEWIRDKHCGDNKRRYKNDNAVTQQLEIKKGYESRNFNKEKVDLIEVDGIRRIRSTNLSDLTGKDFYIQGFIRYRLGYEPYNHQVISKAGKTTRFKRFYLTFEECLLVIGTDRYSMIRDELVNELRAIFGLEIVEENED